MRRYAEANHFVREMDAQGKLVAAICHGPWVLCSANILKGRRATSFFAIKDDVIHAGAHWEDAEVVVGRQSGHVAQARGSAGFLPGMYQGSGGGAGTWLERSERRRNLRCRDFENPMGRVEAVRGIDFEVQTGEVFGLLGPNGAGKTTTVEILEGTAAAHGRQRFRARLRPRRATAPPEGPHRRVPAGDEPAAKIMVREALDLFASFYSRTVDTGQLLDRLQLGDKAQLVLHEALGRPEAARGAGARAGERSGAAISR